jgi:hypothetical protein
MLVLEVTTCDMLGDKGRYLDGWSLENHFDEFGDCLAKELDTDNLDQVQDMSISTAGIGTGTATQ